MQQVEATADSRNGTWRLYYCRVCGHIEWLAPDELLPQDFRCPLCSARRAAFIAMHEARYTNYGLTIDEMAPGLARVDRVPGFSREWQHYAYLIRHPDGLILYDAPPVITPEAIDLIRASGRPRLLVVSHRDFLGPATLWANALDVPLWMGAAVPIGRNRATVTQRVTTVMSPYENLEVLPAPGHSPGSIALYWSSAPGGPILCAGDALAVATDAAGRTQLAYFQTPPIGPELASLTARPVETLAACGGVLRHASKWLERLPPVAENCARLYLGERGGLWIEPDVAGA